MPETVFITGASSGIGAELARQYSRRGALVGLVGRSREKLDAVAATLAGKSFVYAADVTDLAAMQSAARDFTERAGVPDVVIGNAGISTGSLTEHADDYPIFCETLATNVNGLAASFQPFISPMRERRRGTLVGIASVAGIRGIPGASAYSASKAAAISYLESLRLELRGNGVAVVTIAPGFIATPMTEKNPYRMPFILGVEDAVSRFIRVIDAKKSFAIVPWQMAIMGNLLRCLPNFLYDRLLAGRPRKPRRSKT